MSIDDAEIEREHKQPMYQPKKKRELKSVDRERYTVKKSGTF